MYNNNILAIFENWKYLERTLQPAILVGNHPLIDPNLYVKDPTKIDLFVKE